MEITKAVGIAARIWTDPEYSHVAMNPDLAFKIAGMLVDEANRQELGEKPGVMAGLTEGRMVHYVMPNGEHRPAIVVRVWRVSVETSSGLTQQALENGCCQLQVFTDGENDYPFGKNGQEAYDQAGLDAAAIKAGIMWRTSIIYSAEKTPGTWHWIEQAN